MMVVRLIPRNLLAWILAVAVTLMGYYGYTLYQKLPHIPNTPMPWGSPLPGGENIPGVPFISCGQPAAQPAPVTGIPTVESASYAAGASLRDFRGYELKVADVRDKMIDVARWVGGIVGSFAAGNDGDAAPSPAPSPWKRATPGGPPPRYHLGGYEGCGSCPSSVPPDVVQAATAALAAGFTGQDLITAVAVAGAESGYRADAANPHSSARGVWQIMQSAHRDKLVGDWSDPYDSATVAHRVWVAAGRSWSPWVGYTSGAYKAHLAEAQQVAACTAPASFVSGRAGAVIQAAESYLGVPYVFGGSSRSGIDCSGLVQAAYRAVGVSLPRVSAAQMSVGVPVPLSQLAPGDLVGFDNSSRNAGADHVAIALGGDQIIEAAHPGTVVRVRTLGAGEGAFAVRIL